MTQARKCGDHKDYCIVRVVDPPPSKVPPSYTLMLTCIAPGQVSGAITQEDDTNRVWPPPKAMRLEEMIVSTPQSDVDDITTVYLFFPDAQLVTLPKTPTLLPGEAVYVLNIT